MHLKYIPNLSTSFCLHFYYSILLLYPRTTILCLDYYSNLLTDLSLPPVPMLCTPSFLPPVIHSFSGNWSNLLKTGIRSYHSLYIKQNKTKQNSTQRVSITFKIKSQIARYYIVPTPSYICPLLSSFSSLNTLFLLHV